MPILHTTAVQELCFWGLGKNLVLLYGTLRCFHFDTDMNTLLVGNESPVGLVPDFIYILLSV